MHFTACAMWMYIYVCTCRDLLRSTLLGTASQPQAHNCVTMGELQKRENGACIATTYQRVEPRGVLQLLRDHTVRPSSAPKGVLELGQLEARQLQALRRVGCCLGLGRGIGGERGTLHLHLRAKRLGVGPPRTGLRPEEGVQLHRQDVEQQPGRPDQVGEQHAVRGEDVAPAALQPDPAADEQVPHQLMRPLLRRKVLVRAELKVDVDATLAHYYWIEQIVEELDRSRARLGWLARGRDDDEEMEESDDAERPERLKDLTRDLPVGRKHDEQPKVLRHEGDKGEGLRDAGRVLEGAGGELNRRRVHGWCGAGALHRRERDWRSGSAA
mmetsp:Transcript_15913/g.47906  ORF Transcript_15913/g.47906 Transcript_15913/m.47906 type:complete len:327 (+) Transcript_15913:1-981(+)